MNEKIRVGIVGYGNMGKGAERAILQNRDMELVGIFTRREPKSVRSNSRVYHIDEARNFKEEIDVMLLCGGSASDLPEQGPLFAKMFNTVDSFDTHAKIPEYFSAVDLAAKAGKNLSLISTGWDPGLFSINRVLGEAILPDGLNYTFWGPGVSQGHSDAIRRIKGVKDAVQYTIPIDSALDMVRKGELPQLTTRQKHTRVCYVVPEDGANHAEIRQSIQTMPNYFADYDTEVNFVSEEVLKKEHSTMPHGGFVLRGGKCADGSNQLMEFSLKLESNPSFTANVLVGFARAVYRMRKENRIGAISVFDIPIGALSKRSSEELRKELL